MTEQKNAYPNLQGEKRHHGRRRLVPEQQLAPDGSLKTVLVPQQLIPIESAVLAVIDYFTESDPRQPEVDGYSLVRQIDPDIKHSESRFGTFYRVLQRLSRWGYLGSRTEILPMGGSHSGRMTSKTLYRVTEAGRNRLESEALGSNQLAINNFLRAIEIEAE